MNTDVSRIEKVEVVAEFPVVHAQVNARSGGQSSVLMTMREKDARDLMHAIGSALGYDFTKK